MSNINPLAKELSAKIVYVGPGLSGKTTSLQYIHSRLSPDHRSDLLSLATEDDRTLFFDFLPLRIPRIDGLGVRLQLYTVPGQVFYAATRKLVLDGADGVVFVADAQRARREANIESLTSMQEHLVEKGVQLEKFPLVLQYNKQDLDDRLEDDELREDLNPRGVPEFRSTARTGEGVVEALRSAVRGVVESLNGNNRAQRWTPPNLGKSEDSRFLGGAPRSSSGKSDPRISGGNGGEDIFGAPQDSTEERRTATSLSELSPVAIAKTSNVIREDEILIADVKSDKPEEITTERPTAGVSFAALWESNQRAPIAVIESCISAGRYSDAVHQAASALTSLLSQLPVPRDTPTAARAGLLGLDGQEYLKLCRLASRPNETIRDTDALFALYILVATRVKILDAR